MVAAKCAAPPSSRSSRSTEVTTTWARSSAATALRHAHRLARIERAGLAGAHIAEGASPRAGVAHQHEGGVALAPALADIGTSRLLADRGEAMRAQDLARRVEACAPGALTLIQAGLGRTGVSGSRAFSGWRGRAVSTSDLSSTVTIERTPKATLVAGPSDAPPDPQHQNGADRGHDQIAEPAIELDVQAHWPACRRRTIRRCRPRDW